ncbi:DUF4389 domain-containing protein [Rhodobacteraceae bacterium 2376]|uniref:DUF4389 domain-containing protein n=1 Tax=Rhabdonatronobacter sediminivivens TaxID=2743469 RepID=A0A7Z0KWL3_9RHOB|nr:DUF4389 domain-containing protein [Rhabdonatronobacter sediminivivens]NYS23705.1 DUF4389 domain-containing protein [Rhabdonatronobacter sediminivivens]
MNQPSDPMPPPQRDELLLRLVYMILLAMMISLAQSILFAIGVVQFVILLVNNREPNERLADFGCMVGAWVAKAARYLSIATDAKPWPWRDMD